ncbi:TBC1 domain family member 19 isoform X2 [Hermetia illucens]|uniref:TBC1 domain family member 19 isoform X2 n=1 Tax=Hermetia illucens TaxID=343691 RepID=UPI0018CC3FD5|nr:TBC1 domain family member 19 isoform X2 [Hermetia illucens]
MEELKDTSIHHTALKLTNDIKTMKIYESLYRTVQKLVCTPNVDKNDMRTTLEDAIRATGLEIEIRNILFHLIRSSVKSELKASIQPAETFRKSKPKKFNDPLSFLKRAGLQWDRRVRKSLNAMCTELKISITGQVRSSVDKEEMVLKWEELSNYAVDLSNYRPVYAPKDLLDVLLSLKGPSKIDGVDDDIPKWEFAHIPLPVKNFFELRVHFADLLRLEPFQDLTLQCQRVLNYKHTPLCQQTLRKGNTPPPYRGALWSYVLGSHVNTHHIDHWEKLKANVLNTDLIVDKLVFKDIQLTASNDDQYFVFEDVLYQVMLCFSRDSEISEMVQGEPGTSKMKQYEGPPSGVVPFHGICMFAAPFCYLYDSPVKLYFTFRAFYIRYCHRLTTISTHHQGIVSLCLLFEKLLQTHEPQLWSHFRELQIQPIRIVFKWLMRAFSGHLPPDQLLILWDLVLGFDSLEILSLFAIIVLSFRKESLMQVSSLESVESILADLSSIKVSPLIQLALSRD